MIPSLAVIPTHNRPAELAVCVAAIHPQVDYVLVIDNASEPEVDGSALHDRYPNVFLFRDGEQPPNLSRLWNLGLAWGTTVMAAPEWDVAILNDDAIPPAGWMAAVSGAMREAGAAAGCSHPFGGGYEFHGPDAMHGVSTRLTGWAFVLRGELGERFDESMRWWYSDDDMSMRTRQAGGLVYVGGFPVPNTLANTSTSGVLAEQSGRDGQTFAAKWGRAAW